MIAEYVLKKFSLTPKGVFFFTYENACRFSYNTYLEKNIVSVIFSLNPSYFNFTKKSINNLIW